jgi:threonyl-tRNA synthetase
VQFDFNLPRRFELEFVGEDGAKHRPYMVHRALLGSLERFFGVLIEHYAGAFPVWLAPLQVKVLPITDAQMDYARAVTAKLADAEIRVELDERNEKIGFKIREAQLQKVPYMLVIGAKEVEADKVAVRDRKQGDQGQRDVASFIASVREQIDLKS